MNSPLVYYSNILNADFQSKPVISHLGNIFKPKTARLALKKILPIPNHQQSIQFYHTGSISRYLRRRAIVVWRQENDEYDLSMPIIIDGLKQWLYCMAVLCLRWTPALLVLEYNHQWG